MEMWTLSVAIRNNVSKSEQKLWLANSVVASYSEVLTFSPFNKITLARSLRDTAAFLWQ